MDSGKLFWVVSAPLCRACRHTRLEVLASRRPNHPTEARTETSTTVTHETPYATPSNTPTRTPTKTPTESPTSAAPPLHNATTTLPHHSSAPPYSPLPHQPQTPRLDNDLDIDVDSRSTCSAMGSLDALLANSVQGVLLSLAYSM